jgi:N-acetylneuraminate synthase
MSDFIEISGRKIGRAYPPFLIAEMSGNHNNSLDRALEIVDSIAQSGAHAIKLQTYTAESMTLDLDKGDFLIDDPQSLWNGRSLYSLYEEASLPYEWHKPIFERARDKGLIPFSTPFDSKGVDFLEGLGMDCYKIASFENTDLDLIRYVAKTGKPMIISVGMASIGEIDESVKVARASGCKSIALLKCTSAYPAGPESANISTIPHLSQAFNCQVGLSDHTMGVGVSIAAVAFGASIVEKHFTLNRLDGGVDSSFSMEPSEFKLLSEETYKAWAGIGSISYGASNSELKSLQFRRSLYVCEDVLAGDEVTVMNVRPIRPGYGLSPKYLPTVKGRRFARDLKMGTPLSFDLLT